MPALQEPSLATRLLKGAKFLKFNCLGPLKPLPDTQQVEQRASLHHIPSLFIVTLQVILVVCQGHRAPQVPQELWCVSHSMTHPAHCLWQCLSSWWHQNHLSAGAHPNWSDRNHRLPAAWHHCREVGTRARHSWAPWHGTAQGKMWSLSLMVKAEESHRMVSTRAHPAKTLQVGLQDSIPAATERAMLVAGKCLDKAHPCSGDG